MNQSDRPAPAPGRPRRLGLSLLLLSPLWACAAVQKQKGPREVALLIRQGAYDEALTIARRLVDAKPGDAAVQRLYRDARVHEILSRCREAVFAGEPEIGLAYLQEAREIDPQSPTVNSWTMKIRIQLAEEWLNRAAELRNGDRLEDAREAYERSLAYAPANGDGQARQLINEGQGGLARVLLLMNYRAGLSKTKFDEGIRSFRDFLLHQARHSFAASESYDPANARASVRGEQVDVLLAEDRLALAQSFEEEGLYFAARNEYRLVLIVDPHNTEARLGLDRMDREVRANARLDEAEMKIRRGDLDQAGEILEGTESLTQFQQDEVSRLEGQIEDARLATLYRRARDFERDYRYPEAVQAFDDLLEVSPYYEDAIARKSTIQEFIALAEEYYGKALEAQDDDEAESYLRRIHPVLWPEYKDVVDRLEAIEARRAQDAASNEPSGG